MKTILFSCALTAALAAGPALADAKLAQAKQCNECHAADKEVKGPSYRAIAKNYRGTPDAEARMAQKILKGGAEHWGKDAMPSPAARGVKISEAEAKALAKWVLSTK